MGSEVPALPPSKDAELVCVSVSVCRNICHAVKEDFLAYCALVVPALPCRTWSTVLLHPGFPPSLWWYCGLPGVRPQSRRHLRVRTSLPTARIYPPSPSPSCAASNPWRTRCAHSTPLRILPSREQVVPTLRISLAGSRHLSHRPLLLMVMPREGNSSTVEVTARIAVFTPTFKMTRAQPLSVPASLAHGPTSRGQVMWPLTGLRLVRCQYRVAMRTRTRIRSLL